MFKPFTLKEEKGTSRIGALLWIGTCASCFHASVHDPRLGEAAPWMQ